ncbi:MAG: decarboxylating NADP(+)-dependent phosphogluconate dehydrogenase [Parachlamydiales bacterium]|jgi:6-phosphogluconate dehydrogenase
MAQADIGLIGLAVMGQNLALNIHDKGYKIAVFNRTVTKVDDFLKGPAKNSQVIGTHSLPEFVKSLKQPRKIIMMVKAGQAVDELIAELLPLLDKGDILIDGGNSLFTDTNRRTRDLDAKGILFVGAGISGGEEGARNGPSIMPGGNPKAWPHIKEIFQSIAAKVETGEPCCDWVGDEGAGHYVKMVHNGIEYGDIQLICESYQLLKNGVRLDNEQLSHVFASWNEKQLNSYLIEITSHVFRQKDEDGKSVVDQILDVAGQKGTGKWTAINALDLGMPLTLIGEAVFARNLSSLKTERERASKLLKGPQESYKGDSGEFIEHIRQALYASKIISYAQGFMLMHQAAVEYKWNLNYGAVALLWRGGCIIRSQFLGKIKDAYAKNPKLENLLLDDYFVQEISSSQAGWRNAISSAVQMGVPTPCFSSALAFYDGYRSSRLPANLLQALRDYFGAHTYERIDRPRGEYHHTDWINSGTGVSAGSYNA